MTSGKLYIHATNVHQGGGKSLLSGVLAALVDYLPAICQLDSRMVLSDVMPKGVTIRKVPPTLLDRFRAELWLAHNAQPKDLVLCFGNLPPLFKLHSRTIVFLQNRYLIDRANLAAFPIHLRMRLAIERLWLSTRVLNAQQFVVQTPTMKNLLEQKTAGRVLVRTLPFCRETGGYIRNTPLPLAINENKTYDFIYVATGEPHKNHRILFESWCHLAKEGFFPSLCVTLDTRRFSSLCNELEMLRSQYKINVTNVGELPHQQVLSIYREASAVVFPSTFESFGLPLIEARQAGLPVVAAELDYVRDVLDPEQSFDPNSTVSIARAVKRHMGWDEPALSLLDASGFLGQIINPPSNA